MASAQAQKKPEKQKDDESEDESEVLEESPCGRWHKRKEQVTTSCISWREAQTVQSSDHSTRSGNIRDSPGSRTVWLVCRLQCESTIIIVRKIQKTLSEKVNQGNMPGIESTFLAMDTEEGVEVVWNELQFTDKRIFKSHEDKIRTTFQNLMVVDHPNVVKFHKYWLDVKETSARVVFITEYVSSGSLRQFLKKTKKNRKTMNARAWKRWCTQILSALSYLHSCDPVIIHGNLTNDTIFIQHNGLIKIGSVWHRVFANELPVPDDLRAPLKSLREEQRSRHFFPPEYGSVDDETAVDIFSFGMCALEMAVLEIQANGDKVSEENITKAINSLEDTNMKEFILRCLSVTPELRPSAHNLLFHRVLFEVHSLKLLSAHCFLNTPYIMQDNLLEDKTKLIDPQAVMASIPRRDQGPILWRYSQASSIELDKFLEDVRNGIHPLMNFAVSRPHVLPRTLSQSQEDLQTTKTPTPEPLEVETRKVIQMHCNLERRDDKARIHLTLYIKLEDKLHRHLSCDLLPHESPQTLASELVHYGFISEEDCQKMATFLDDALHKHRPPLN